MQFRTLGLRVQELEVGPYVFLMVDGEPIAYKDGRENAEPPGLYKTDTRFSKAATRAQNKWIGRRRYVTIPHDEVKEALNSVSRFYNVEQEPPNRRENPIGRRASDRTPVESFVEHVIATLPRTGTEDR